ncbi:MAG: glycerol-3-phosphate 1-O-acyltransferase PlsY [Alphaproteobacteria bacterium]|nr:glycerol-3-phosphate 1-O-acyltransferase PlsY [Alphaproteobacteria bacterium]
MEAVYALLLGYAIGSVPFGLIFTRLFGAGDLRAIGSGNIGATNVLRTGRKGLAVATLLLDLAKGLVAVVVARSLWGEALTEQAAIGAFVGHCFPVWLMFRGGKGVATTAGICLGLAWPIGAVYAAVWLGMLATSRISSLAGMSAAVAAPLAAWGLGYPDHVKALAAIALAVIVLHRANISRLLEGEEPRVGSGK